MSDIIKIKIGEKEYNLKFTREAVTAISGAAGGLLPALRRIQQFDFSFFAFVILAGTNKLPKMFGGAEQENIENELLKHGLPELVEGLSDYVSRLANGGKPLEVEAA